MKTRGFVMTLAAAGVLAAAGCGGPATFVSTAPPPETSADAWFVCPPAKVRGAVRQAAVESGFSLNPGGPDHLVTGTKQQMPYIDEETSKPTTGPLPLYELTARITREEKTHIRLSIDPVCTACDGQTPYEWEYPVDLLRDIMQRTTGLLRGSKSRIVYPGRYRPPEWHRPVHR